MNHRENKNTALRIERDKALFAAYNRAITQNKFKSQEEAIEYVRTHEAPRFYIDPWFCHVIISRLEKGKPWGVKGEPQMKRIIELYRRYRRLRERPEWAKRSILSACMKIVDEPAPEFYVSYRTARYIIASERERQWKQKSGR